MAVCRINDEQIDTRVDERGRAFLGVGTDSDRSADPQAALGVLGSVRELDLLLDILDRD